MPNFRAHQSDVDYTMIIADKAGQAFRNGDPEAAARILRAGIAETTVPELRKILQAAADRCGLVLQCPESRLRAPVWCPCRKAVVGA